MKDGKPVSMHMFPVTAGTLEYQEAVKEFEATIKRQHTIVEVKRVQNRNEYAKHVAFVDSVAMKHGSSVDRRRLFHGSKQESLELIAHQGFNRNFAADANGELFIMCCVIFSSVSSSSKLFTYYSIIP